MSAPGPEIRPARPDEVDAVLALYEWLFAPPGTRPPDWDLEIAAPRLLEAIEADLSTVLVGAEGDRLVGFCTAYLELHSVRFGRRCWVEDLAVDPAMRSRGIGARLLAAAREWASAKGATHLELDSGEARADAHRFYEREGPAWRSTSFAWVLGERKG